MALVTETSTGLSLIMSQTAPMDLQWSKRRPPALQTTATAEPLQLFVKGLVCMNACLPLVLALNNTEAFSHSD